MDYKAKKTKIEEDAKKVAAELDRLKNLLQQLQGQYNLIDQLEKEEEEEKKTKKEDKKEETK